MSQVLAYAVVVGVVLAVKVLPAFGPPTWSVLLFFRLNEHLAVLPLVLLGAIAATGGRTALALAFRLLRGRIPAKHTANLLAAGKVLTRDRKRSVAGLALFVLSPLPSAQLFEAAGLIGIALPFLAGAFLVGRLVSYTLYVDGANAAAQTSAGHLVTASFTSPWGVGIELLLVAALVGLARIDWVGLHDRHQHRDAGHRPVDG